MKGRDLGRYRRECREEGGKKDVCRGREEQMKREDKGDRERPWRAESVRRRGERYTAHCRAVV